MSELPSLLSTVTSPPSENCHLTVQVKWAAMPDDPSLPILPNVALNGGSDQDLPYIYVSKVPRASATSLEMVYEMATSRPIPIQVGIASTANLASLVSFCPIPGWAGFRQAARISRPI
jgi:hypothetical protein